MRAGALAMERGRAPREQGRVVRQAVTNQARRDRFE